MFNRIRWRLVGWTVLVLVLILAMVGVVVYASLAGSLTAEIDRNLSSRSDGLLSTLEEASEHPGLGLQGYSGSLFFLVLGPDGKLLDNPQQVDTSGLSLGAQAGGSPYFETSVVAGEPTRLFVRPVLLRHSPPVVFVVGESLAPEQHALERLLTVLLIAGLGGLLLSLGGAWFLAGRALVPIQQTFRRQSEFVGDASHELRTPLTVMRAAADLLNRHRSDPLEANGELFDDLRYEIGRMERLSADLLALARSDLTRDSLAVGEIDVAGLAADVVRRMTPLAQERGVSLGCESQEEPLLIEGDPDRLQQLLLILLDNGLKHTPKGGIISVVAKRHGHDALIAVSDNGEGIAPEHLPRIFDRFYRADKTRSRAQGGAGLGLSIAKAIVEAHAGQLAVDSALGSGTTVTVRLRLLPQQPSLAGRLSKLTSRMARRSAR